MNGGEGAGVELFSAEGKAQEILRLSEILEGEEIQQKLEQILDGIVDIVWADRDRLQKGELPHELQEGFAAFQEFTETLLRENIGTSIYDFERAIAGACSASITDENELQAVLAALSFDNFYSEFKRLLIAKTRESARRKI